MVELILPRNEISVVGLIFIICVTETILKFFNTINAGFDAPSKFIRTCHSFFYFFKNPSTGVLELECLSTDIEKVDVNFTTTTLLFYQTLDYQEPAFEFKDSRAVTLPPVITASISHKRSIKL